MKSHLRLPDTLRRRLNEELAEAVEKQVAIMTLDCGNKKKNLQGFFCRAQLHDEYQRAIRTVYTLSTL